ncbi:HAD family hydrolase [Candidatus Micrarchaeota archaeon]|nr:HAD family hydrolase [Candidatus Micrarchaeota archaeon]
MQVLHARSERHTTPIRGRVFLTKQIHLEKIKLAIFDVDGTLYPGISNGVLTRIFLRKIFRSLDKDALTAFESAYLKMKMQREQIIGVAYGDFRTGDLLTTSDTSSLDLRMLSVIEDEPVLIKLALIKAGIGGKLADRVYHEAKIEFLRDRGIVVPGINDEVYEVLRLLGRMPKVVATNSTIQTAEEILKMLGVYNEFEKIYELCKKPSGLIEVLVGLLERKRVDPHEAIYIGDSYGLEIIVARALGIPSIYISRGADEKTLHKLTREEGAQAPALVIAQTMNEVARYLDRS